MSWELDKTRPICPQLEEQICVKIANGEFKAGEKIMSVRDVAVAASVNPNTVQKAFECLENLGLLISVRGSGWYVSENTGKAKDIIKELVLKKTEEYLNVLGKFGLNKPEILSIIKEWNE